MLGVTEEAGLTNLGVAGREMTRRRSSLLTPRISETRAMMAGSQAEPSPSSFKIEKKIKVKLNIHLTSTAKQVLGNC